MYACCTPTPSDVHVSAQGGHREDQEVYRSYTESRARYAEVLDSVANDRDEVIITRAGHDPVVIVSLEDYERLEAGRGEPHDLIETV